MTQTHTHLIWDFNGTILQDMDLGIRCTNTMLAERGLPVIPSVEAYREIFGFPIDEYYRRLGFDFEKEDYLIKYRAVVLLGFLHQILL